jgi:hypothetical protein
MQQHNAKQNPLPSGMGSIKFGPNNPYIDAGKSFLDDVKKVDLYTFTHAQLPRQM